MPKNYCLLIIICFFINEIAAQDFITTWKTDNPGLSEGNQITIPTSSGEIYDYSIDWGDGTRDTGITGDITHTYQSSGEYQVSISGVFPRIWFGRSVGSDKEKLLEINQWGSIEWKSFAAAFFGCTNLEVLATDVPDLTQVTTFSAAFSYCPNLRANNSMNQWDMSHVQDFSYMFYKATAFNQQIGDWDLSNAIEVNDMFNGATMFNQEIGNWRFPNVTSINSMFERATNFNGDISIWDVSNIEDMSDLFLHAYAFNRDISSWDVGNLKYTDYMFSNTKAFNQDISGWNVSSVISTYNMFSNAGSFDQNLGNWNVENIINMYRMFSRVTLSTENYDGILNGWASQTNLKTNVVFDAGISHYCEGDSSREHLVNDLGWQITDSGLACPPPMSIQRILLIDAVQDEVFYTLREDAQINTASLPNSLFNIEVLASDDVGSIKIELSDTQEISSISNEPPYTLFGHNGTDYLGNNLPTGTYTLIATPYSGDGLTGLAGEPYVMNFKILNGVARAFITTWKTDNPGSSASSTINIRTIPGENYYYDVSWGDGTIYGGVSGNTSFTYNTPGTYTVKITGIFPGIVFENNGDAPKLISIDQWGDVDWSSFEGAFSGCMNMELHATDIPDLSNVESLARMFKNCTSFKGNLSMNGWDISGITNLSELFWNATKFDQDISGWNISGVTEMNDIFTNSGLSDANYELALINWSQLPDLQSDVSLGALQNHYCGAAEYRQKLIIDNNWTIRDGGLALNCAINGQLPFLTTWKTNNYGASSNNQITIYTDTRWDGYDYTVEWGDGTMDTHVSGDIVHTYAVAGTYRVAIYGGFPGIYFNNGGNARLRDDDKILSIDQWGDNPWTFLYLAFAGCKYLQLNATDIPNFSKQPSLFGMFTDCPAFTGNESMESWDMESVDNTAYMFQNATSFNMPLNSWDMRNVKRMYNMFKGASKFDQDLSDWDISNVINMEEIFVGSGFTNENYNKALIAWALLPALQEGVTLDAPQNKYCDAENARQSIIDSYNWIINDAGKSCPFITTWKTGNMGTSNDNQITIPTLPGTYYNYNVDWGDGTYTNNVSSEITHTYPEAGTYTVSISGTFPAIYFNAFESPSGDEKKIIRVDQWGSISWQTMAYAFAGCSNLDVTSNDIPNLGSVRQMQQMFAGCQSLKGNSAFQDWDVRYINRFDQMFASARTFNQDIGNWNMSNAVTLRAMFNMASNFNIDIGSWDVDQVTDLGELFKDASLFNQDVSAWNVSMAQNANSMFSGATAFNQSLAAWDIQKVIDMSMMFSSAGLDTQNYDKTLIAWSKLDNLQYNVPFDAGNSQYCVGMDARQQLMDNYGWIITDDGETPLCKQDIDQDGIADYIDECLDTSPGVTVNSYGCDLVPTNSVQVFTLTPSCSGSTDGVIEIIMDIPGYFLDIGIEGNGTLDTFNDIASGEPFRIGSLPSGSYQVTLYIPEIRYEQQFGVFINEITSISGKRMSVDVNARSISYTVSGSHQYDVRHNGKVFEYYFDDTGQHNLDVPDLQEYNEIEISGINDCQGSVNDSFYFGEALSIFPTIASDHVELFSSHQLIQLGIYDLAGELIRFIDFFELSDNRGKIDISTLPSGLYLFHIKFDGQEKVIKIIKR